MTVPEPSSSEWATIGDRVRAARERAGMSVRELARRVDVSASHVSQAERGLASFSVRALYNVVHELGISMDSLFDETPSVAPVTPAAPPGSASASAPASMDGGLVDAGIVLRADRRPTIPLAGGTRWERLTPRPEIGAEFIEVVYPPAPVEGAFKPIDYIRHSSREYGVVTSGVLTVQVGFDQAQLYPGDSITFDSVVPHRFWNETQDEVRAIWFIWESPHASGDPESEQAGIQSVPTHDTH